MIDPIISIIIPVYNAEVTLNKCLDSVLRQSFRQFEILLIDDGSNDKSGYICDEYALQDNRIRVFHKANGGVSSARNLGLKEAIGEWITFVDADDWVYSDWLKNFISAMTDNCDLVVQGFIQKAIGSDEEQEYGFEYSGNMTDAVKCLYQNGSLGFIWVKLFKRDIIRQFGIYFHEELSFSEDYYMVMEYCSAIKNVICVSEIGYYYNKPDWNSKYAGAVFADMKLLKDLCHKALANNNSFLFSFYIDNIIHGIFDAYIKSKSDARHNLLILKEILSSYDKQKCVECQQGRFKLLAFLLRIDSRRLWLTDLSLRIIFKLRYFVKR